MVASKVTEKEEGPVIFKMLKNGYTETKVLAFGEIPPFGVLDPTKPRETQFQNNHWIEYIFEPANFQMEIYKLQ